MIRTSSIAPPVIFRIKQGGSASGHIGVDAEAEVRTTAHTVVVDRPRENRAYGGADGGEQREHAEYGTEAREESDQ